MKGEAEAKKVMVQREEARIRQKLQEYKQTRVLEGKPMREGRM